MSDEHTTPPPQPLSPDEAAGMLDTINARFARQQRQIMVLSVAMLALAAAVLLMQLKGRGDA